MANGPGGLVPNQGNPPAAKGTGKNSKRHDLERPTTPGLHGSDLQKGDVKKLEEGQRITKKKTQAPANQVSEQPQQAPQKEGAPVDVPDPIEFLGGRSSGAAALDAEITPSQGYTAWLPFVRQMAIGPGSSGLMAGAYINQFRQIMNAPSVTKNTVIDLQNMDDALEAGLDEGF